MHWNLEKFPKLQDIHDVESLLKFFKDYKNARLGFEAELRGKLLKMQGKSGENFYRQREARRVVKEILGDFRQ